MRCWFCNQLHYLRVLQWFIESAALAASTGRGLKFDSRGLRTIAAILPGALLSALATATALPALAIGARWTDFFFGEFSVAILVEPLERFGCFGKLISVYGSVVIQIECFDKRALRTLPTGATTLPTSLPSALLPSRASTLLSALTVATVWRWTARTMSAAGASTARTTATGAASLRKET